MGLHLRVFWMTLTSLVCSQRCSHEVVRRSAITIPLPDASYDATARFERFVWWRPFRRSVTTKLYTKVEIPDGIPYFLSGEPYSLYEYSVEGHDLDRAIARGTEIALKSRTQNQERLLRPSVSSIETPHGSMIPALGRSFISGSLR
jgi:hypothetical protein